MLQKEFYSATEASKILGVSRTQVHRLIKSDKLPAVRVGRNFIILSKDLLEVSGVSCQEKQNINKAVDRVFEEYGETIRKLGSE